MLKEVSIRRRLNLPDLFRGLRLRGETDKSRVPYDTDFIQTKLLACGALDGLNEDARFALYFVMETGLRPSEVVNLQENTVSLDAKIPYVKILPKGRRLKMEGCEQEIPLVGVALAVMKLRPQDFSRHRDESYQLFCDAKTTIFWRMGCDERSHRYSLRHSFKDRLIAAEAPDSLIDSLMGHKSYKPKYGKGPSLELKLKFLELIALRWS